MKFLRNSIWALTGLIIALPLTAFVIVHWYQNKYESLPFFGGYDANTKGIAVQHSTDDFAFQDQDGETFSSEAIKNKIVITNFFFTSCTSVCPNMMSHVKKLQDDLINDNQIAFISFTVDPVKDSASRLKWYCNQYHISNRNWNLMTGNKREIYKLARKSFFLSAGDGDGGENDFIHSDQLVLVDKNKHIRGYYDGTDDKALEQIKHDIKKLEYEN